MALANTFIGFNPALAPQLGSITAIRHIFEPLLRWDFAQNAYVPQMLAGMPEQVGTNTYSATLRPGLTFHDGTPVTGDDVAWTFDYYKNPDTASFYGSFLGLIDSVTAGGDAITFNLAQEFVAFPFAVSVPMIMPRNYFESIGSDEFSAAPVGSGPYRLESSIPGMMVQLQTHAEYAGAFAPQNEELNLEWIVEDASREVQLLSGQLDIIDQAPYRDLPTLQESGQVETGVTFGGRQMIVEMNQHTGPFSDERVRQAWLYGIDRQTIIDSVFPGGTATFNDSQLPASHPYYVEPSTVYRYDPDRATSLLTDAGFGDGLDYEMLLSTIPWITQVGTLIKEQLDAIGMRGSIRLTETEAGYGIVAGGEYDVFVAFGTWIALGVDADTGYRPFNYGPNRDGFYGTSEKTAARDAEYDRLVDAAFAAQTVDEQIQGYLAVQELFSSSVPNAYAFLSVGNAGAWQPYVQGYAPGQDDVPELVNVSTG